MREREKRETGSLFSGQAGFLLEPYLPGIRRMCEGNAVTAGGDLLERGVLAPYPALLFLLENGQGSVTERDYARLLLPEGSDEDRKGVPEEALDYEEDSMHLEGSMESALREENERYLSAQEETGQETEQEETQTAFVEAAEKSYRYRWEELSDYDSLIKAFYAVDSSTVAGEELLQTEALLEKDMRIRGSADAPQILIYHTHSKERFADSAPGDESEGILGAGAYLAKLLRERYGYNVIHDTGCYDEDRDYAYSNSLPAVEALLSENPSIEAVIDLHRDEMPEGRRLVLDLQGRPTAQFMFFNGLCRTKKGPIEQLENPYLTDNLSLAFQMQAACNEYYPGIARRIYLRAYRYNMHLSPKSMLIELGAQNNTEEEIHNACDVLAHVLHLVFSGQEPERD
ncbi:MAG: stage II sporulation protein P [Bacteroidales bacterium]|nr:stage II sporulation protein P [Bacteroidales bacterium]MCM1416017.1 stage II sporulation protein P [bacterium]MCM1423817.1 stage II sporulation protein P [bacterium]